MDNRLAFAIAYITSAVLVLLGGLIIARGGDYGAVLLLGGVLLAMDPLVKKR